MVAAPNLGWLAVDLLKRRVREEAEGIRRRRQRGHAGRTTRVGFLYLGSLSLQSNWQRWL